MAEPHPIMKRIIILICQTGLFFSSAYGDGEKDQASVSPEILTIGMLVREALSKNPELRALEMEVQAAKGERTQAGLWKNPELSGVYGPRRVSDSGGNLHGEGRTRSLTLLQTFEFPGKGSLRKAIADRNVDIAELGLEQFRLALRGKVNQLAYRYATNEQQLEIAREISDYGQAQVELLKHRLASGIQGLLELRVIEASFVEIRMALAELEQSQKQTLTELNILCGRPANDPLRLKLNFTAPTKRFDLRKMVQAGLSHNFQLKARETELLRADDEVTAAQLAVAPDFQIGPFYTQDKAVENEVNMGVAFAVTVPLWDWNQGNIAAAEARHSKSGALLNKARRDVEAEIVRRFHAYELALKQLGSFEKGYLEKMHDAADMADRHYRLGAVNVQIFLETQRQYLNAGRIYGDAVVAAHENLLDLQLLTGITAEEKP